MTKIPLKDIPAAMPPPRPPSADRAEVIALRAILSRVIVELAGYHEAVTGDAAGEWVDRLAVSCRYAVMDSILDDRNAGSEQLLERAAAKVDLFFGDIGFGAPDAPPTPDT